MIIDFIVLGPVGIHGRIGELWDSGEIVQLPEAWLNGKEAGVWCE